MSQRLNRMDELETNSTVYRHQRRGLCSCPLCPPHGGENRTRYGKHGRTKRRYKDHRRNAATIVG